MQLLRFALCDHPTLHRWPLHPLRSSNWTLGSHLWVHLSLPPPSVTSKPCCVFLQILYLHHHLPGQATISSHLGHYNSLCASFPAFILPSHSPSSNRLVKSFKNINHIISQSCLNPISVLPVAFRVTSRLQARPTGLCLTRLLLLQLDLLLPSQLTSFLPLPTPRPTRLSLCPGSSLDGTLLPQQNSFSACQFQHRKTFPVTHHRGTPLQFLWITPPW